ncbi:hypothetical protein GCM10010099_22730 [Streptomyces cinereus]|nr:hypothetical protein GCM10010099_22730 [Streptomyces cinereus]
MLEMITATPTAMSAADIAAHELASYVRRRPVAASDEHGKTKEPLPPRPRGPHPYRTKAVR